MAGTVRFTATVRRAFLEHLKNTANVTEAARRVNISRSRMYDLRRKDPALAQGWDEALAATTDRLEAEAVRRAVEGVEKPYFFQGKECGTTREYSDTLMKFLLQKRLPERYGDGGPGMAGEGGSNPGPGPVVFEMHLGLGQEVKPGQRQLDQTRPGGGRADHNQADPSWPDHGRADPDTGGHDPADPIPVAPDQDDSDQADPDQDEPFGGFHE